MTLSYSTYARVKRAIQARHGLITLVVALAALAFLLGPIHQAWGAPSVDINRQESNATTAAPMIWTTQRVNPQRMFINMGDHSLRLDSTGKAHVAYGGDRLYYASYDGANWSVETVDVSDNVGQYASLFIDSANHPHISYYDAHYGALKYARNLGSGWEVFAIDKWSSVNETIGAEGIPASEQIPLSSYTSPRPWQSAPSGLEEYANPEFYTEVISHTQGVGLYTSIALDAYGNPYISYYDAVNGDLKCARMALGFWRVDIVDSTGVTGMYTSLAVDDSSPVKIYISYYDYTNGDLRYAVWDGTNWSRITADAAGNVGQYSSLALDNAHKGRISYYDVTNKDLKYASWTGSAFVTSKVDGTSIDAGMYSSIALKDGNIPNISYYNATPTHGNLRYASFDGGVWSIYTISTDELSGWYSSIALDPANNWYPRVSSYSSVSGQLMLTERTATTWISSMIDQAHDQGFFVSMDLDSTEKPHMAFFDDVSDVLDYAYWDGAAWHVEVVDANVPVGLYCSLILDTSDKPHISYWDAAGRLKYATKSGGGWQIEFADPAAGVGQYTSIGLDTTGLPYISYYDETNKDLRLAHKLINGTWEVFVVDSNGDVGLYSSLVVNSSGPHISYYDKSNKRLKYALLVSGQWWAEVIDPHVNVGPYSSLALDSFGNPHIAYFRDDDDSLMYAYYNGSWSIQWLDGLVTSVGFNPSIALDSSNNPHISYYRLDTASLKYARWTGSEWILQTVDSEGDVGLYSSIKVLSSGNPVIAYYDATNGDLKYATSQFAHQVFLPILNR